MKVLPLMLSAAVLFAGQAQASPRDVRNYLQRAGDAAAAEVAAAGVDVGEGLDVQARIDAEGRLTTVRVVRSTGSLEIDRKAVKALKRLRVAGPPNSLLGADVTIAVGKAPLSSASP